MRAVAAVFVLLLVSGCQAPPPAEMTEAERAQIEAEVNAIHAESLDAWRAVDVDRGLSFYPNIPEITYATDGDLFVGPSEVEDEARAWFADVARQTITITESHTTVLSSNIVCINQRATYTLTNNAGVTAPESFFAGTYIWVLRNGEWKMEISHESTPNSEDS
jgi:hypothetical protein